MDLQDDERVRVALRSGERFHRVEHRRRVGSTNDVALRALQDGHETTGLVVVADAQTAGRGRSGEAWTDDVAGPHGPANLAVTATTLAPDGPLGLVPLATGLAVLEVFERCGADGALKWPNDVLLSGRKAAGILVERHRVDDRDVLLIGCGLDLDWRGVPREDTTRSWTSLAEETGRWVDRGAVLALLLEALARRLDDVVRDVAWLRVEYVRRCASVGSRLRASLPDGAVLVGDGVGIDEHGRLKLRVGATTTTLSAGAVTHLRPV